jgi:hypothetical protein
VLFSISSVRRIFCIVESIVLWIFSTLSLRSSGFLFSFRIPFQKIPRLPVLNETKGRHDRADGCFSRRRFIYEYHYPFFTDNGISIVQARGVINGNLCFSVDKAAFRVYYVKNYWESFTMRISKTNKMNTFQQQPVYLPGLKVLFVKT